MRKLALLLAVAMLCPILLAQQALNNDGVIKLVKAGLSDDLVVSTINASPGTYDTTANGLIALKTAGVSDKVIAAIVAKSAAPASEATPAEGVPNGTGMFVLKEGTDVPLKFDQDISSKTAAEGDPVTFVLAEDLKVGEVVVAKAGCKAFGEVTNAKKSGMMGKAGELNVRLDYLSVGKVKIKLRGAKGKEGESGTTGAVVLTVLFGPIGLIKHGKNIDIKTGSPLKVYVSDDISLPAAPPA